MHTVDLGIRQYVGGCIVYDMFRKVGGTFRKWHDACGILLNLFRMAAAHINVAMPFNVLTLGMIRAAKGKKTKLKLKAYEGRKFTPILIATLMIFSKLTTWMAYGWIVSMHWIGAISKWNIGMAILQGFLWPALGGNIWNVTNSWASFKRIH